MNKNVSRKITILNFAMTMGIVLYHYRTFQRLPYSGTPTEESVLQWFSNGCEGIGSLALGFFFMLSGFLLYQGADNSRDMFKKLKKRCYSLGIPYILWNCIIILFLYVKNRCLPFQTLREFIKGFTISPFDGPLWYITALLLLMLPAPLLIHLKKRPAISMILLAAIFAASVAVSALKLFPTLNNWEYFWWLERFIRYCPSYFAGAFAGIHCAPFLLQEKYPKNAVCIIASVLFLTSALYICLTGIDGFGAWLTLRIQPILLWFAVDSRLMFKKPGFPLQISFFIYATHQTIIIPLLDARLLPYVSQFTYSPYGIIGIRLGGVLLVYLAVLLAAVLMKYLLHPKFFSALSGNRVSSVRKTQKAK